MNCRSHSKTLRRGSVSEWLRLLTGGLVFDAIGFLAPVNLHIDYNGGVFGSGRRVLNCISWGKSTLVTGGGNEHELLADDKGMRAVVG
jgi:hypothetical protein